MTTPPFTDWTRVLDLARAQVEPAAATAMRICAIPAPTHLEAGRGEHIAGLFAGRGCTVERDEVGNVYARRGTRRDAPALLVLAHMDTVFPLATPLHVAREGAILRGPGIGDNCLSVAGMLAAWEILDTLKLETQADVIFCSNVGEEGLGNLRGAWAAVNRYRQHLGGVIAVDGDFGHVLHAAVGSRRFTVQVHGPGGHSFSDFGVPSAIHGLARGIAGVAELSVPAGPRTTYNIGTISGGTSVNTIAARAEALVDVRSEDMAVLAALSDTIMDIFRKRAGDGLTVEITVVGDRPAGKGDVNHPLVQSAARAIEWFGVPPVFRSGSTDANVPISLGIPGICFGVSHTTGVHTVDEATDITNLERGLAALTRLIIEATAAMG